MNIEGITQLSANYSASLPKEPPVIDEKAIKSILFLCIQGEVLIEQNEKPALAENHTIDTFA